MSTFESYHDPPTKPSNLPFLITTIKKYQSKIKLKQAEQIATSIQKYSKIYNFPEELILALIKTESTCNPKAVSSSKCLGLMQIKPSAHSEKINKNDDLFDIDTNIRIGCQILKAYYDREQSIKKALYRYRGKKSNYYVSKVLSTFTDIIIEKNFTS